MLMLSMYKCELRLGNVLDNTMPVFTDTDTIFNAKYWKLFLIKKLNK